MAISKFEKSIIDQAPTLGYWSCLGGVEVKDIDDFFCTCISNAWYGKHSYHKVPVRWADEKPYIIIHNQRLYLDDCLRA